MSKSKNDALIMGDIKGMGPCMWRESSDIWNETFDQVVKEKNKKKKKKKKLERRIQRSSRNITNRGRKIY